MIIEVGRLTFCPNCQIKSDDIIKDQKHCIFCTQNTKYILQIIFFEKLLTDLYLLIDRNMLELWWDEIESRKLYSQLTFPKGFKLTLGQSLVQVTVYNGGNVNTEQECEQ